MDYTTNESFGHTSSFINISISIPILLNQFLPAKLF